MPVWVAVAHLVLIPLSAIQKKRLVAKATRHFAGVGKSTTVVAIAGSFGKTTTRHFLNELLKDQFRVQTMPGNINTTMGIAQWLLTKFNPTTQVLLVEMDAYHPGEIAASCDMVRPNIAVLTSIGDQHMVRFGTRARLTQALQEVFAHARPDALRITDADVAKMLADHGYTFDLTITDDDLVFDGQPCETNVSDSAKHDLGFALNVAKRLNVNSRFVLDICKSLRSPDRRQQPSNMFGYDAIDDSYNISETTAHAGIAAARALAQSNNKKLLILTAGIAELSKREAAIVNERYGSHIAKHANAVALLRSVYFPALQKGINDHIPSVAAPNLQSIAPLMVTQFPPTEYVLLVQPEMTDLSY